MLFLGGALGRNVLAPLKVRRTKSTKASVLFLVRAGPKPNLKILLTFVLFDQGRLGTATDNTFVVRLFNKVRRVCFPFILLGPLLFTTIVLNKVDNALVFRVFRIKLGIPTSPKSVIIVLTGTPRRVLLKITDNVTKDALMDFVVTTLIVEGSRAGGRVSRGIAGIARVQAVLFTYSTKVNSDTVKTDLVHRRLRRDKVSVPISCASVCHIGSSPRLLLVARGRLGRLTRVRTPRTRLIAVKGFLSRRRCAGIVAVLASRRRGRVVPRTVKGGLPCRGIVFLCTSNIHNSRAVTMRTFQGLTRGRGVKISIRGRPLRRLVTSRRGLCVIARTFTTRGRLPGKPLLIIRRLVTAGGCRGLLEKSLSSISGS